MSRYLFVVGEGVNYMRHALQVLHLSMEANFTLPLRMEEQVQQYNLKWTNYVSNILQGLTEQLSTESLTDVTFSCEGQLIRAHKMVLSTCSVYFQQLFQLHSAPSPLIIMHGVRFGHLRQIIQFMYQGEIKVAEHDMDYVLALAENLQVKGLCSVRSGHVGDSLSSHYQDKSAKTPSKRRRYSQSSVSETVTSEESTLTEDAEGAVKPESPVISPSLNMSTNFVPSTPQRAESLNSNNASIIEELNAFKILNEKLAALPQDIPIMADIPQPPLEASAPERPPNNSSSSAAMKIPRPPNAFMVFANEWRKRIAKKYPGENNKEISVRLGNIWKTLPMNSKMMYYTAAKEAEKEHKAKYPGYRYSPKEARKRKEVKMGTKRSNDDPYIIKIIPHEDVGGEDLTMVNSFALNDDDEVQLVQDIKQEIKDEEVEITDRNSDVQHRTNKEQ